VNKCPAFWFYIVFGIIVAVASISVGFKIRGASVDNTSFWNDVVIYMPEHLSDAFRTHILGEAPKRSATKLLNELKLIDSPEEEQAVAAPISQADGKNDPLLDEPALEIYYRKVE